MIRSVNHIWCDVWHHVYIYTIVTIRYDDRMLNDNYIDYIDSGMCIIYNNNIKNGM